MIPLKDNTKLLVVEHLPQWHLPHQRLLIMGIGPLIPIQGTGHPACTNHEILGIVTRKLGTAVPPVYTIPLIDPTILTVTGKYTYLVIFYTEILMKKSECIRTEGRH